MQSSLDNADKATISGRGFDGDNTFAVSAVRPDGGPWRLSLISTTLM
jgi:hypothetical protein